MNLSCGYRVALGYGFESLCQHLLEVHGEEVSMEEEQNYHSWREFDFVLSLSGRGHKEKNMTSTLIELWCPFKLSSSFFVLISRMGVKNVNLSFSKVYLCDPDISLFYQNTASINENKQSRKHQKIVRAPVDNCFFIVISRIGIRIINLSFFPRVCMSSLHFLVISE